MGKRPRAPHYIAGFGDGNVRNNYESAVHTVEEFHGRNANANRNGNANGNGNHMLSKNIRPSNNRRQFLRQPSTSSQQYVRGKPVTMELELFHSDSEDTPLPGAEVPSPSSWQYSAMALIAMMGLLVALFLILITDGPPSPSTRKRKKIRNSKKKDDTDEFESDYGNANVYYHRNYVSTPQEYPQSIRNRHFYHGSAENQSPVYRSPSNSYQQQQHQQQQQQQQRSRVGNTSTSSSPYRDHPHLQVGLEGFRSSLNARPLSPVSFFPSISDHSLGRRDLTPPNKSASDLPLPPGVTRGPVAAQAADSIEDTPLAGSRRRVVDADVPDPNPDPNEGEHIPFMPPLSAGQVQRKYQQPPESCSVENLVIQMESGRLTPTPSFAKPPSPPPKRKLLSAAEPEDENDPRNNIVHKRKNLTSCTDTTTSLSNSIVFSELQLVEVIGGGGFGQVWKAMLRGTPVAVKVLTGSAQREHVSKAILEEFAAEINMLKGMRHPNICLYMGACVDPPNRAIVTELAANGSLWDALRLPLKEPYSELDGRTPWPSGLNKCRHPTTLMPIGLPPKGTWPWSLVKRVACGAARGMTHLHSGNPPVLHRDLKSANLLLDESYTTKVCDFGLSRLKAQERSMTGNCGTVQWMAPEILANQPYAEPADVFSFGVILWELLTKECPYDGMKPIPCALAVLNNDARPEIPPWCPRAFRELIGACFQRSPNKRPTFAQIIVELDCLP